MRRQQAFSDERTAAREAYAQLLDAAGTWGPPQPVQVDLAAWRFDSARERIDETLDWLADRDQLLAAAEAAGLTVPQRLRDRYRTAGGGPDARAELDAELAVVSAYAETSDRAGAERGFLAQIGLIGGERPLALLAEARALFAEGELRGAAEAVDRASSRLEQATMDGIVRMVAAAVIIVAALALAYRLARPRRERSTTDYTAAR